MGIQWEYRVAFFNSREHAADYPTALENWLNKLGEDGWNLVMSTISDCYVFKRSKR